MSGAERSGLRESFRSLIFRRRVALRDREIIHLEFRDERVAGFLLITFVALSGFVTFVVKLDKLLP